jgi:hypothetical protein|mmetsp:Transcript_11531/g.25371  ORF Transcript_11531/g.25371 Transcript_11531/m.25371 type:complete len:142 (+) Transcript_11531:144-569(+)|eukprot:scaffold377_cov193-Alexandrium_tamarense.AAC.5
MKSTCIATLAIIGSTTAQLVNVPKRVRNTAAVQPDSFEFGRQTIKHSVRKNRSLQESESMSMSMSIPSMESVSMSMPTEPTYKPAVPEPDNTPVESGEGEVMGVDANGEAIYAAASKSSAAEVVAGAVSAACVAFGAVALF